MAACYVGPRIGRFDKGLENPFPTGDPKTMVVGTFILWWGWVAFNSGSSYGVSNGKWELAARAGAGTVLASMGAGVTTLALSTWKHKGKANAYECISGVISALGKDIILKLSEFPNRFSSNQLQSTRVVTCFQCKTRA